MNRFTKEVLKTIDKYSLIGKNAVVIAAVSGGHDSLCMLYVLNELKRVRGFSLCVAHLNHDFRAESDDDEKFVKDICKKLEIQAYTKKVNVLSYAKKNKISFETAGREIRYDFFDEIMGKIPNSVTATAHNANDSAESFIMHLLRGSGLSGLTGISAKMGRIIRPLIEQSRTDIEKYCEDNLLNPRIDITNEDDSYTRNDIRHNVIPHLEERGGIQAIIKAASLISADEAFLQEYTIQKADRLIIYENNKVIIDAGDFTALPLAIKRRLLRYILRDSIKEVGQTHIDSIISIADKNYGGKIAVLPGRAFATLENGKIIITKEVLTNDK